MIAAAWQVRIERPPEQVFDFVADLHRESEWNPDASNAVRTSPGAIGVGTVWEQDFQLTGHVVCVIEEYERPRRLTFHVTGAWADATVRYELLPVGAGETEVSCRVEVTVSGWRRLFEPLRARAYRRRLEHARGANLKRVLER